MIYKLFNKKNFFLFSFSPIILLPAVMRIDLLIFTFTIFLFALFYNKFLFSDISKYLNYKTYKLFSVLIFIFYKFFIFNETIFYKNNLKLIVLLSFLFISSKFFEKKILIKHFKSFFLFYS